MDACVEQERLLLEALKDAQKKYYEKRNECAQQRHKMIAQYFPEEDWTTRKLLEYLYDHHGHEETAHLRSFVEIFPDAGTKSGLNFSKGHVFECICKVLVLFDYDMGEFEHEKELYRAVETYTSTPEPITYEELIGTGINEGANAQSVDIFLRIPSKDKFILIQNKYFHEEKSSAEKYDVTKIHTRAQHCLKQIGGNHEQNFEIVLMVNNKQNLERKIHRNRNDDFKLVDRIFGVMELDKWFQALRYDMAQYTSFKEWLEHLTANKPGCKEGNLSLRFHQELIVKTSERYIVKENVKKLIWGAVPRSGKSYMIAGMILNRAEQFQGHDIVIILGALNETIQQFKDMFVCNPKSDDKHLMEFRSDKYSVITNKKELKQAQLDPSKRFIYIYGHEKVKVNKNINDLFDINRRKPVDLYYDEIHKGGSTPKAINEVVKNIHVGVGEIDLFVMVTATYAKPNQAYVDIIDEQVPKTVNWSYQDQQDMKEITNPSIQNEIIQSRDETGQEVFEELCQDYEKRFGENYLSDLEDEYQQYPELVIITPELEDEALTVHPNTFLLKCLPTNSDEFEKPADIFEQPKMVEGLMNGIVRLYEQLQTQYNYDVEAPHTELWFLPDTDLYGKNEQYCSDLRNPDPTKRKKTLPNIEPVTRGIALTLLDIPHFREKCCFLIVHDTKVDYYTGCTTDTLKEGRCLTFSVDESKKGIKTIIKECEDNARAEGKTLIILVGAKLRLGISLRNADIALNFDNVQSIDLNYQTMFRVLTERKGKTHGYYIDFSRKRSVQFIYDFNEHYAKRNERASKVTDITEQLQSLLFLFNYNGLNIRKTNDKLDLYNKLVEKLEIDMNGYNKKHSSNISKYRFEQIFAGDEFKEIVEWFSRFRSNMPKQPSNRRTTNVQEGMKAKHQYADADADEETKQADAYANANEETKQADADANADDNRKTDEEIEKANVEDTADFYRAMVGIMGIFSLEYQCDELPKCIDHVLTYLTDNEYDELCRCEDDESILGCFMGRFRQLSRDDFITHLHVFKQLSKNPRINKEFFILYDSIRETMGGKKDLILHMTATDIQNKIDEYLPIRKEEKDKHGEVFTPRVLIDEMLDRLPKSVWRNPELRWLDPANGIGNFPMVVFERLNSGLQTVAGFEDERMRKRHIIDNMLFMVELNEKNVGISRKIFGKKANIFCGSFLSDDKKAVNPDILSTKGFEAPFDIIIGNPPFQSERTNTQGTTAGRASLWDKFVALSLTLLKENGFLGMIHPPAWRGLGTHNYIWNLLKEKQIKYLHIYGEADGTRLFGVSTRVDLYVLQNKPTSTTTNIVDEKGNEHHINLSTLPFLPNYAIDTILNILTSEEYGIDVIYSSSIYDTRKLKNKKNEEYKHPIVHSINKVGLGLWYSNNTKGHFGIPKVMLSFNRKQYSYPEQNDYTGKYGMSQITFGIPIDSKKEGDEILHAIGSETFQTIIAATKWGAFQTDYRMFKFFKKDWYKHKMFSKRHIAAGTQKRRKKRRTTYKKAKPKTFRRRPRPNPKRRTRCRK